VHLDIEDALNARVVANRSIGLAGQVSGQVGQVDSGARKVRRVACEAVACMVVRAAIGAALLQLRSAFGDGQFIDRQLPRFAAKYNPPAPGSAGSPLPPMARLFLNITPITWTIGVALLTNRPPPAPNPPPKPPCPPCAVAFWIVRLSILTMPVSTKKPGNWLAPSMNTVPGVPPSMVRFCTIGGSAVSVMVQGDPEVSPGGYFLQRAESTEPRVSKRSCVTSAMSCFFAILGGQLTLAARQNAGAPPLVAHCARASPPSIFRWTRDVIDNHYRNLPACGSEPQPELFL